MAWFDTGSDPMTGITSGQQSQRAQLANSAMNRGAAHLQTRDYDSAVRNFRLAVAYQPDSADAYRLLGRTYTLMGRVDDAVTSYQRALRANSGFDDARSELATLYLKSGKYADAEREFDRLLRTNPASAGVMTSLGYVYLNTDRPGEAKALFEKAALIAPQEASTHFNLGTVNQKLGNLDTAIDEFRRAIGIDSSYASAYSELAYAYLAKGDTRRAQEQVQSLFRLDTSQSIELAYRVSAALLTPKIAYMDPTQTTFRLANGPDTPLSSIDPGLAAPGASVVMSVTFVFNQSMDALSVENISNWSITRSLGGDGGVYDNGVVLHPGQQVRLPSIPMSVEYDPIKHQATVRFRLVQNATGDGVIDPSHWVFAFHGTDANGRTMDPGGDEYDGFAKKSF